MIEGEGPQPFKWVGGALCLEFNNTVDWGDHLEPAENDRLGSLADLAAWGREAEILPPSAQRRLVSQGRAQPGRGQRALDQARAARRTVHRIFVPVARGEAPEPEALAELNRFLARVPPQVIASGGSDRFGWSVPPQQDPVTMVLWPVVWSAGQLLTSPQLGQVKTCANENCGWLFVDRSRKHNRRWCEMEVCGNRVKVRRFYARRREERRV